jgi:hypothetical protein
MANTTAISVIITFFIIVLFKLLLMCCKITIYALPIQENTDNKACESGIFLIVLILERIFVTFSFSGDEI